MLDDLHVRWFLLDGRRGRGRRGYPKHLTREHQAGHAEAVGLAYLGRRHVVHGGDAS